MKLMHMDIDWEREGKSLPRGAFDEDSLVTLTLTWTATQEDIEEGKRAFPGGKLHQTQSQA